MVVVAGSVFYLVDVVPRVVVVHQGASTSHVLFIAPFESQHIFPVRAIAPDGEQHYTKCVPSSMSVVVSWNVYANVVAWTNVG